MRHEPDYLSKVDTYYRETFIDYRRFLALDAHHGIHYGYFDENTRNFKDAVIEMNRILATLAEVGAGTKVLDAGCGIGGSSVWLAKYRGAQVDGITICKDQIEHARGLALKYGVQDSVQFSIQDYRSTDFKSGSFDVVWAIESVCYAEEKVEFLREARRLLKPGGTIIIADGFKVDRTYMKEEAVRLRSWLQGWSVADLDCGQAFGEHLNALGFGQISLRDITQNVLPFSRFLKNRAFMLYPLARLLNWSGMFSDLRFENGMSAIRQYSLLKEGLWKYLIFRATRVLSVLAPLVSIAKLTITLSYLSQVVG